MPCRAFIDSNSLSDMSDSFYKQTVLMPCRAFIDSNLLLDSLSNGSLVRLNALSGIH